MILPLLEEVNTMNKALDHVALGAAAGAIGTTVLNSTTYVDMLVRGRPSSSVPSKVAGKLAEKAGVQAISKTEDEKAENRRSAAGALMGYATGLSVGLAYGGLRSLTGPLPKFLAAVGLGFAAMAASDLAATKTNVTDPQEWTPSAWLSDIIPHLAYGLATVGAFEALARDR